MICSLSYHTWQVLKGVFGGEEYVLLARSIVLALPRTGSQTWHEVSV